MREIKVKAWSPSLKEWRSDWSISEYTEVLNLNECKQDEDLILVQYTGLKDKNGKEIYEGDVLGVKLQKRNKKFNFTHVVEWEDGIELYGGNHWSGYGYPLPNFYVEVIGNIYENPELLEKK